MANDLVRLELGLPIESERLCLRDFEVGEQAVIDGLYANRKVQKYIGNSPFRPNPGGEWEQTLVRVQREGKAPLAICNLETGAVIRFAILTPYPNPLQSSRDYELSIAIAPVKETKRKHFGREAARALSEAALESGHLDRVVFRVSPTNQAALILVSDLEAEEIGSVPGFSSHVADDWVFVFPAVRVRK